MLTQMREDILKGVKDSEGEALKALKRLSISEALNSNIVMADAEQKASLHQKLSHICDKIKNVHMDIINDGQAIDQIHEQVSTHIKSTPMLEWILRENTQAKALASLT